MSASEHLSPMQFSAGRMNLQDISRPGTGELAPRPYSQRALTSDVKRNGIKDPIAVASYPDPDTGEHKHFSINGMHRLDAGQRAGVSDAPVIVSHPANVAPPLSNYRPATREEFDSVYNSEGSGKWGE